MALDTRDKRASALLIGLGFGRVRAAPDGSLNAADRRQAALCYRGIATASPSFNALQWLEYTARPRSLDYTADARALDYRAPDRTLDYAPRER